MREELPGSCEQMRNLFLLGERLIRNLVQRNDLLIRPSALWTLLLDALGGMLRKRLRLSGGARSSCALGVRDFARVCAFGTHVSIPDLGLLQVTNGLFAAALGILLLRCTCRSFAAS